MSIVEVAQFPEVTLNNPVQADVSAPVPPLAAAKVPEEILSAFKEVIFVPKTVGALVQAGVPLFE
jgi:hypothetical protein